MSVLKVNAPYGSMEELPEPLLGQLASCVCVCGVERLKRSALHCKSSGDPRFRTESSQRQNAWGNTNIAKWLVTLVTGGCKRLTTRITSHLAIFLRPSKYLKNHTGLLEPRQLCVEAFLASCQAPLGCRLPLGPNSTKLKRRGPATTHTQVWKVCLP